MIYGLVASVYFGLLVTLVVFIWSTVARLSLPAESRPESPTAGGLLLVAGMLSVTGGLALAMFYALFRFIQNVTL